MIPIIILTIENEDDREFMMRLYVQYRSLLYSEIIKVVRNTWDAEDLLQTVTEKLIDRLPLLKRLDHKGLINYLITAAKHTAYNFCRDSRLNSIIVDDQNMDSGEPALEDDIIRKENLICLSQVWDNLDEKTQYLLCAKYILQKSGKEIAKELNMPANNVRMAIVRAKRKAYLAMQEWKSPT